MLTLVHCNRLSHPFQLLWHFKPSLRRQMPHLQQVVLQLEGLNLWISHRQPFGQGETQRSHVARRESSRRDYSRVLLLWRQERLHSRFHSSKVRHCRRLALSVSRHTSRDLVKTRADPSFNEKATLCCYAVIKRHCLGHGTVVAADRGSFFLVLARQGTVGARTTQGSSDIFPTN